MPPSAAPEWLRVGWSFESSATSAPASNASIAARMPAQPAPTTSTSCAPSTARDANASLKCASALRSRREHVRVDILELGKVVPEHAGELAGLRVVRLRIAPGRARIEQRALDAGHRDRDREPENLVGTTRNIVETARERRMQERAGRVDRHPVALACRAARPAGVDEPHGGSVLRELLAAQLGVDRGRLGGEWAAEAPRERGSPAGSPLRGPPAPLPAPRTRVVSGP